VGQRQAPDRDRDEIDALPEGSRIRKAAAQALVQARPGHMEGHNTTAQWRGAAHALKRTLKRYKLPARCGFVRAGRRAAHQPPFWCARIFQGRRAAIRDSYRRKAHHVGFRTTRPSRQVPFHGKTAHGAVAPWEGKDALEQSSSEHRLRQAAEHLSRLIAAIA